MKLRVVKPEEREEFIPNLVAMNMRLLLAFENLWCSKMGNATKEYKGGMLQFVEFENGAKSIMVGLPDGGIGTEWREFNEVITEETPKVPVTCVTNYYEGKMSLAALSLACTAAVCSMLSFSGDNAGARAVAENYHKLVEVFPSSVDLGEIYKFLD